MTTLGNDYGRGPWLGAMTTTTAWKPNENGSDDCETEQEALCFETCSHVYMFTSVGDMAAACGLHSVEVGINVAPHVCTCVRAWMRACVRGCVRARDRACMRSCVRACVGPKRLAVECGTNTGSEEASKRADRVERRRIAVGDLRIQLLLYAQ